MRRLAWYIAARFCAAMARRARSGLFAGGVLSVAALHRVVAWDRRAAKFSSRIGGR